MQFGTRLSISPPCHPLKRGTARAASRNVARSVGEWVEIHNSLDDK